MAHTPRILLLSFVLVAFLPLLHTLSPSSLNATGFSFELVHRDSVRSPLYSENLTKAERVRRLVNITQAHLLRLEYSLGDHDDGAAINPPVKHIGSTIGSMIYAVKLGIGSPPTKLWLQLDTGSDLTWTQGNNCLTCFPQNLPVFSPAGSSTYLPLQCGDQPCRYTGNYGVGHVLTTSGSLAQEDFYFQSRMIYTVRVSGITFGCSDYSDPGFFTEAKGKVGGILGMGFGKRSLVSQLGSVIPGFPPRFSYCLLPSGNSYLRFGNDIRESSAKQQVTRLSTSNGYYILNLKGISLNGRRLSLHQGPVSSPIIIDPGVPFSLLSPAAYYRVTGGLKAYFERQHHLRRVRGGRFDLDLCYYKHANGFNAYPSLTFHFEDDAKLRLRKQQLFLIRRQIFCLTMKKSTISTTILGAAQQVNFQFVHDLGTWELGFARNCTQN